MANNTAQSIVEDLSLHWANGEADDEDEISSHISCAKRSAELADDYDTKSEWGAVVDELEEVIVQAAEALATIRNTKSLAR